MTAEPEDTPTGAGARSRRVWWVIAAIVAVIVGAGAVTAYLLLRESTTPVDVDEAVGDFRRQTQSTPPVEDAATTVPVETTTASTTPPETRPASTTTTLPSPGSELLASGVYTYRTTGRESIDALGGRSHRYPEVSTITVTHEGCGAIVNWRPLQERWDATTLCPSAGGLELRTDANHHEFFGITDEREFVCERGALLYPATTTPGVTWTARCSSGDVDVVRRGTILGTSEVQVGGSALTVLDFEVNDEISGASEGTTERTIRVVPATGLVVEQELVTDVRNDSPIGDVHYTERYSIRLTALAPRR
jgi:hypothetical protein